VEDWTQQVDHLGRKSILWIDLIRGWHVDADDELVRLVEVRQQ
jgi:hypothetical protein